MPTYMGISESVNNTDTRPFNPYAVRREVSAAAKVCKKKLFVIAATWESNLNADLVLSRLVKNVLQVENIKRNKFLRLQ